MANIEKVTVPDIGGAADVDVIEVFVKPGDTIAKDASLITLEGDKATMEVPSTISGVVKKVAVKVGDKVSEGSLIVEVEPEAGEGEKSKEASKPAKSSEESQETAKKKKTEEKQPEASIKAEKEKEEQAAAKPTQKEEEKAGEKEEEEEQEEEEDVYAGPGVRRLAREFSIDLSQVQGSGNKQRILKDDLQNYVKQRLSGGAAAPVASAPVIDFSKFGKIETKALSKIQKISGAALHRNWVNIPHVTQFGEADVTEMEEFRIKQKISVNGQEIKLTPLVFIMKAVVAALKQFPHFNASLAPDGGSLILKKYFHLGVAVDTPHGLVVPVIRDVDQKSLIDLANELAQLSHKARETGLKMTEMQGGCFSISSLGGIGGTAFTPIINAPEVAILGVSRTQTKPVYHEKNNSWQPRLMLPLSLSYDHRVVDGADGARFMMYLISRLNDIRSLLL
jgi:pyruvate dehydrogenase E2 component (dihydrolipoamide acetyltransferase)